MLLSTKNSVLERYLGNLLVLQNNIFCYLHSPLFPSYFFQWFNLFFAIFSFFILLIYFLITRSSFTICIVARLCIYCLPNCWFHWTFLHVLLGFFRSRICLHGINMMIRYQNIMHHVIAISGFYLFFSLFMKNEFYFSSKQDNAQNDLTHILIKLCWHK